MIEFVDDDDDMADLFSFGADGGLGNTDGVPLQDAGGAEDDMADMFSFGMGDGDDEVDALVQSILKSAAAASTSDNTMTATAPTEEEPKRRDSLDNLLASDVVTTTATTTTTTSPVVDPTILTSTPVKDAETQEFLEFLDEEPPQEQPPPQPVVEEETTQENVEEEKKDQVETIVTEVKEEQTTVCPVTTLSEALLSSSTTIKKKDVLRLFQQEGGKVEARLRPQLWSRIVCAGKSLEDLLVSSLADSYMDFKLSSSSDRNLPLWIKQEADRLAPRVCQACPNTMAQQQARDSLQTILLYHSQQNGYDDENEIIVTDPLLPPVVCTILSTGIPELAAHVFLSSLIPSFMPFLALTHDERLEAASRLHAQFYLLACYHLPLLVYHLDRYVPGWYWPQRAPTTNHHKETTTTTQSSNNHQNKEDLTDSSSDLTDSEMENVDMNKTATRTTQQCRNLREQGVIPQSWLMTHLAGESSATDDHKNKNNNSSMMDPHWLIALWDFILTTNNNSMRFFLALGILEKYSDTLLDMTGEPLVSALLRMMEFSPVNQGDGLQWIQEWSQRAKALMESTPDSVVSQLRTAEDEAVSFALQQRQKRKEEEMQRRLEAEAKAHRLAQEKKAEMARQRLTRARLVAFYRKYNPEKEENVDNIMEKYQGRYEELDLKLKKKYGTSFNPAVAPKKKEEQPKKETEATEDGLEEDDVVDEDHRQDSVSVTVKVGETVPYLCMSKEKFNEIRRDRLKDSQPMPLKFFLVDSRSEEAARQQGRFKANTAQLSPETLMDPEQLDIQEEKFESLRGSSHICIMGEGYSAIPSLYGQISLTPKLQELVMEDESRTLNCALFFKKRGFPFVSVLEGGFAAAHAFLVREGQNQGIGVVEDVLTDYDAETSMFGQMEALRQDQKAQANVSAREKTTKAVQNLIDSSMTSLALSAMKIEQGLEKETTTSHRGGLSRFFGGGGSNTNTTESSKKEVKEKETKGTGGRLGGLNLFSRKPVEDGGGASKETTEVEDSTTTAPETTEPETTTVPEVAAASSSTTTATTTTTTAAPPKGWKAGLGMLTKRNPFARFGGKQPNNHDSAIITDDTKTADNTENDDTTETQEGKDDLQ